jgi:hypothetical protein
MGCRYGLLTDQGGEAGYNGIIIMSCFEVQHHFETAFYILKIPCIVHQTFTGSSKYFFNIRMSVEPLRDTTVFMKSTK